MMPASPSGEFLSTPSARRATGFAPSAPPRRSRFLSTPSARRATGQRGKMLCMGRYFYPRPPRGGRPARYGGTRGNDLFLSTPSARRATLSCMMTTANLLYFYPRPPRGGRLTPPFCICHILCHFYPRPPRGGRRDSVAKCYAWVGISIHALREEGDLFLPMIPAAKSRFLSTPSARRATTAFLVLLP